MKRVMLMMVLAALLLTQCRRPSIEFPSAEVSMTVTAGPGSKTDISTEGGIVWSTGDKLYVGCNGKYAGCLSIVSGVGDPTGTFTGTVTGVAEGTHEFHFFYLGNANYELTTSSTSVPVDFSSQDIYADGGKLKNANRQHVGYGTASGKVDGGAVIGVLDVAMKSKVAIAYFHFESGTPPTPYEGALTLSGDHIYSSMTVGFGGTFSPGTKGDISIAGGHAGRYVMLVPPENVANETLNFSGDAEGCTALENGIEANKFYRVDGSMPIVVSVKPKWVDLGLSVKWATCNLGAEHEYDYGDYYQWGGVTSVTSTTIYVSWVNCPGNGGSDSYEATAFSEWRASNLTAGDILKPEVDAAHVVWGGDWRMPTAADFTELIDNTTCTWMDAGASIEIGGQSVSMPVAGCYCVSKKSGYTGKYIFLPAAGRREGTRLDSAGSYGYYWSSSLPSNMSYGRNLYVGSSDFRVSSHSRYFGCTVRPVCPRQH